MIARTRQRGVAMLIVLWACTLLAILLGGFAVMSRTEGLQARYQFAQAQAHYAAEAGLVQTINGLMSQDPQQRPIPDGRPYPITFDDAKVIVTVIDEDGKVDLNSASGAVLQALFQAGGAPLQRATSLAAAVQDWRSFGIAGLPNGAKAPAYKAAGLPYGPRNGPFATIEELQQVLGMDNDLYEVVAPVVTIWSGRERPNPVHAPPLALAAIPGMTPDQANALLATRQDPNASVAGATGVTHSIRSEATLADGTRAVLRAVVRLRGAQAGSQPYAVLRWQEGDSE